MDDGLGEYTPRNIFRKAKAAAAQAKHSCEEALANVLIPRLMRVLAPFREANEAVSQMFFEMDRENVPVPGCDG